MSYARWSHCNWYAYSSVGYDAPTMCVHWGDGKGTRVDFDVPRPDVEVQAVYLDGLKAQHPQIGADDWAEFGGILAEFCDDYSSEVAK